MLHQALSGDLLFAEAFEIWLSHRTIAGDGASPPVLPHRGGYSNARYLATKTTRDYQVCAKALTKFFGRIRLDKITEGHHAAYQQLRATNPVDTVNGTWRCVRRGTVHGDFETLEQAEAWAKAHGGGCEFIQTLWAYPAGAGCIRKELALLERILCDARLWGRDEARKLLKVQAVEPDVERAMSPQEQHRLLHVASGLAEYRFIYQYVIVALQTTAGPNELRQLRLGDVFLAEPTNKFIQIPRAGAKNKYRKRTIPLITEDAVWAMEGLVARARELGAWSPAHYLFPFQAAKTHYDPNRPMSESGLKKPWDALRKAAGMPRLHIYDLRHTGITRMAEAGVPLPVAMSFAGHMTQQMQQHYTAISLSAQRQWGAAVWGASIHGPSPEEAAQVRAAFGGPRKPVMADRAVSSQPSALSRTRRV